MRDVNIASALNVSTKELLFYLNYEGCKLHSFNAALVTLSLFYLNYEGCKRPMCPASLFIAA